jgi:hypothetical protein
MLVGCLDIFSSLHPSPSIQYGPTNIGHKQVPPEAFHQHTKLDAYLYKYVWSDHKTFLG